MAGRPNKVCDLLRVFDASLAFRKAADSFVGDVDGNTRKQLMDKPAFHGLFEKKKQDLSSMNVVFIEIDNPIERYLFEVYCAMEFATSEWNTFETH